MYVCIYIYTYIYMYIYIHIYICIYIYIYRASNASSRNFDVDDGTSQKVAGGSVNRNPSAWGKVQSSVVGEPVGRRSSLASLVSRLGRNESIETPITGGSVNKKSSMASIVRTSVAGKGDAPRVTRVRNSISGDDLARERFLAMHEEDILNMMNFFEEAGLGLKKVQAYAEEAIFIDAASPRKLFKYVLEVPGFSLAQLGMDENDAARVLEVLDDEFASGSIISGSINLLTKQMSIIEEDEYGEEEDVIEEEEVLFDLTNESRPDLRSFLGKFNKKEDLGRRGSVANLLHLKENDSDVKDMEVFFRKAGLGQKLSNLCAEEAIVYDISSPKKLYRYLQDEEGFTLVKLGTCHPYMYLRTYMNVY
jgi:hypothetical protein